MDKLNGDGNRVGVIVIFSGKNATNNTVKMKTYSKFQNKVPKDSDATQQKCVTVILPIDWREATSLLCWLL